VKSSTEREARQWGGTRRDGRDEFKLFYLSGDLLSKLNDLTDPDDQAELVADLIRQEHERRFGRD
jgi:hypothetical protein